MNEKLRQFRDAVVRGSQREVRVDPDGRVREVSTDNDRRSPQRDREKPTKLARRTFGGTDAQSLGGASH